MNKSVGFILVLLAGVGFGFLGIFGRWAFQSGLTIGELLTFRFTLAAIILWLYLGIFKRSLLNIPIKQVFISSLLGLFGYAVFSTLYFKSIQGVSVPLAAMLLFTFPIFVTLGSHFILKERMNRREVLSLILACSGLAILLWGPMVVHSMIAIGYGLGSGITYSIYVLASGRYQKKVEPISSSLYVITAAAIGLYLFHRPDFSKVLNLSPEQMWIIGGIATISTIGPLTLFLAGLQRLPSTQASIIVMIEPVIAAAAAWYLLGEQLSQFQMIGAGLVLLALILNARK